MKNNMSIFENDFFNILIDKYGFYIEEVSGENSSIWVAIKNVNDSGLYCVIVSKEKDEHTNYKLVNEYLENKSTSYSLHNILLSKDDSLGASFSNYEFKDNYHRVILNASERRISEYNKASEPLMKIITNMLSIDKAEKKTWYSRLKVGKITFALIAINIIVFVASVIVATILTGRENILSIDPRVLYLLGAKHTSAIVYDGEFYRLLTSMFLHGGIVHLFFNMYALYTLGDTIEAIYGKKKYLLIYFLSGIIASIASLIFSPNMGVGASGAIFGLLGALLVFAYFEKHRVGKQLVINVAIVIIANIIIGLSLNNIDNFAHIGGLLGGILLGLLFYRYKIVKRV